MSARSAHEPLAIVLGAAGFIGSHVVRRLKLRGWRVAGIGRGPVGQLPPSSLAADFWVRGSTSIDSIATAAQGLPPQLIVNCAGGSSVASSYVEPFVDFQNTVTCTAAALEFLRLSGEPSSRFVLASSGAVYGDQGDVDLSETATRSPMSPYGFNKVACENLCDSYSRFFGVRSSIVRLFSVYGEGLRKQLLWDAAKKFTSESPQFLGTGNEIRDWIHVDDAAELLVRAGTETQSPYEVYNAGHEHASTREVLVRLATELGAQRPTFTGEVHPGNPRRMTANSQHAQRNLGWHAAVSLIDGIPRYARWYREAVLS